jgi:hypothetical protein
MLLRTRRSSTRETPRGLFGSIGLMTLHSQSVGSYRMIRGSDLGAGITSPQTRSGARALLESAAKRTWRKGRGSSQCDPKRSFPSTTMHSFRSRVRDTLNGDNNSTRPGSPCAGYPLCKLISATEFPKVRPGAARLLAEAAIELAALPVLPPPSTHGGCALVPRAPLSAPTPTEEDAI